MKALFALLTVFVLVFCLGCQETAVTDPGVIDDNAAAQETSQNLASKDLNSTYPGVIHLFDNIYDPTHPFNGGDKIEGFIRYDVQPLPLMEYSSRPTETVKVRFYVNILLDGSCPIQDKYMKVVGFASEILHFYQTDTNAPQIVTKVFDVCNLCCGSMKMMLKFAVHQKEVSLYSMKLLKIGTQNPNINPK